MRVLILDLDTLRPDHLGCYGYHRNTSPNIDRIAGEGVRFDSYFCPDAPCLPSRTALLTGRFGIHTGVVNHGGSNADPHREGPDRGFKQRLQQDSLWGTFRRAGLKTVSVSPFGERHSAWQWYAGLNEVYNTGKSGNESAEEITPVALDWIERNGASDDWVLHVNYWDPHTLYRAPSEFGNPFENEPLPEWLTEEAIAEHRKMVGPHTAREVMMYHSKANPNYPRQPGEITDMASLRQMIDGYDCGIAYMDSHIGQLFAALEKQGVTDDLAVIITADHGENQGELGIYGEHATADQITCRIPMIVRWPGMQSGHVDDGFHYNLDLLPTLAELLGVDASDRWDGSSYAPALRDAADCGRKYLVLSQCAHVCQRSVRFGPWLWMRTYHDGFHLFPEEMLYNIATDPHETTDEASARSGVCAEAARIYNRWHGEMMATAERTEDPLWEVIAEGGPLHAKGSLKRYCERLEATDRGWAVPELKARHPREFA